MLSGVAGREARWVELQQSQVVLRQPLESPLGLFVVALELDTPAVVRILDGSGVVLMAQGRTVA